MHIFTYRGRFGTDNGDAFKLSEVKTCKPILFMTPSTCKAGIFLQVERSERGTWSFSCWALLEEEACKDMWVHLSIAAPTKRCYSAKLRMLPALSKTKSQAYKEGECMILVDSQIREVEYQDIGFDFALRILTTKRWKKELNRHASKADQLRLEEKLMGEIVPHKFQKYTAPVDDPKIPPWRVEPQIPVDPPIHDPEEDEGSSDVAEGGSGNRRHYLLTSPPTPGQDGKNGPALLGPPPPTSTNQRCPPLQIWPPAQLVPMPSGAGSDQMPGPLTPPAEDADTDEELPRLLSPETAE